MFHDFTKKLSKWATAAMDKMLGRKFSRNEGQLDATEYDVKRKLGQAFFTRRQTPATRRKHIEKLTHGEWLLAQHKGWL